MPPIPAESDANRQPPIRTEQDLAEIVARVTDEGADQSRRSMLLALARGLATGARTARVRALGGGRWMADVLMDTAPKIPIRDKAVLRAHHPGLSDDQIADQLIKQAAGVSGGIGAAAGALAAVEFAAPPTLLAVPAQLAAETVAIAAVEVKLIAELHEIFDDAVVGSFTERGLAYLMSWTRQRAIEPAAARTGLAAVLGQAAKRELRVRMLRRLGRSSTSLAPFLAGAVAGAEINRRGTRALGGKIAAELRDRRSPRH